MKRAWLLLDGIDLATPGRVSASTLLDLDGLGERYPRRPLVPATVLLEAMAQAVGWAIVHAHGFTLLPILSLVQGLDTRKRLAPGTGARVVGEITSTGRDDSLGRAHVEVAGEVAASVERLIFTHRRDLSREQLAALLPPRGEGVGP